MAEFLYPDWPAPAAVRALATTRYGGVSRPPFDSFNLGDHVGDDPEAVRRNRRLLVEQGGLPAQPHWLEQVHGTRIHLPGAPAGCADGSFSNHPGQVCAVLTADCLPVLLCNGSGTAVAAVHAGWRGLAAGVLEAAVDCFPRDGSAMMAWLGPAIGPDAFEVGSEVYRAFVQPDPGAADGFRPAGADRWRADLYFLARRRLERVGITRVYGGDWCTHSEPERFFSYRRDGHTGRMASLIWLQPRPAGPTQF